MPFYIPLSRSSFSIEWFFQKLGDGTLTAMTDLGIFMGPVVMGIVIQFTSYPTMFLCLSLIGIFSLVYFQFFVRDKRALPRFKNSLPPNRLAIRSPPP